MKFINHLQEVLAHPVHHLEINFDKFQNALRIRLGGYDPILIVPYRGYGTTHRITIKGRVLEDHHVLPSRITDTLWDKLAAAYRRMDSDEVPFAKLKACSGGIEREIQADEEGYFEVNIEFDPPLDALLSQPVEFALLAPFSRKQEGQPTATGEALISPPGAKFGVISDIDDTVIETNVKNPITMVREVFLSSARTRKAFPGAPEFYRALNSSGGSRNPLFFVSSSPWNIYDVLTEFFTLHSIPDPVLFLRDWGITETEILPIDNQNHKKSAIKRILDTYPALPFILLGDSGQQDPEIYAEIFSAHPRQIIGIYIRKVGDDQDRAEEIDALISRVETAGGRMILADDTQAFHTHAAEMGWIES